MTFTLSLLTFVSTGPRYSTYLDENGCAIYLANGHVMTRMIETDEIPAKWDEFEANGQEIDGEHYYLHEWLDYIRDLLLNEDDADEIDVCGDCECITLPGNSNAIGRDGDERVCEACYQQSYSCCYDCEYNFADNDMRWTLSDERVCERCIDYNYYFCESCDGYYSGHDGGHDHHDGCDCESDELTFAMPFRDGLLDNDVRETVTLPAGTISDQGIREIHMKIYYSADEHGDDRDLIYKIRYEIAGLAEQVGNEWQTRQGNYTKRLSRAAYKAGHKLSDELLAQIGNIARAHSGTTSDFEIEITRDLNMSAEDFYHEGSCWWESYSESRCALKTNGGIGLRSFRHGGVSGRAWIMPLKAVGSITSLLPTYGTTTADAFVVFNGYGELDGYSAARIVAFMTGKSYRKIRFDCSPMYVNGSMGYLVASEEILAANQQVRLHTDQHSTLFHTEAREAMDA